MLYNLNLYNVLSDVLKKVFNNLKKTAYPQTVTTNQKIFLCSYLTGYMCNRDTKMNKMLNLCP